MVSCDSAGPEPQAIAMAATPPHKALRYMNSSLVERRAHSLPLASMEERLASIEQVDKNFDMTFN
jgi:hypothetical protein